MCVVVVRKNGIYVLDRCNYHNQSLLQMLKQGIEVDRLQIQLSSKLLAYILLDTVLKGEPYILPDQLNVQIKRI